MINKIIEIIKFFYLSINTDKRKKINFLIILMTISSIMEFLSIGSIIPLISTLLNYDFAKSSNFFIKIFYNYFSTTSDFQTTLIIIFGFIIILSAIFRLAVFRLSLKLTALISSDLASNIYKSTINQSYNKFIKQSTNVIISSVTEKNAKITGVILALFQFFSGVIIMFGVLTALLVHNFSLTMILIISLATLYIIVASLSKFYLKKNSKVISKYSEYRIKFLQESFGNIRDIILDKLQNIFSKIYFVSEKKFRLAESNISTIAGFPKIIIESFGIILLLLFVSIYFSDAQDNNSKIIISLGVFAYAANRILPMFHNVYQAWAQLMGNLDILEDVKLTLNNEIINKKEIANEISKETNFKRITFKDMNFSYNDKNRQVLEKINLSFDLNQKIGIVGKTGSGKSTFIDLIMGLLEPVSGKILVDDKELKGDTKTLWQMQIAHVPQDIFLINDSIKNNITFNIDEKNIDTKKLEEVISISELKDFINSLNQGLDTIVGENGINISGGQKQRIGIARALYKNKKILIIDEATSALDYETENKIINNITQDSNNITLISITHRIGNLKNFHKTINLDLIKT